MNDRTIASSEQEAASTIVLIPESVSRCLLSLTQALDMKARRLQPTFLLRCVALGLSIAAFLLIAVLAKSLWPTIATLALLFAFWRLAIEGVLGMDGLLLTWIEHRLTRRAGEIVKTVPSLWVRDLDAEDKQSSADFHRGTEDNPTIR
jgi:hypothetical protein